MKGFKAILREVNFIVTAVLIFDIILASVLIFLSFYLALMLFSLNPWYSLLPTIICLGFLVYKGNMTNKYRIVEEHYQPLYEKLRTSADNVEQDNVVVDELEKEVVKDLQNVRVSSFVKIDRISYKVLGCILLCLIILFVSIYNVSFGDFNLGLDKVKELVYKSGGAGSGNSTGDELVSGTGGEGDQDIFGENSMAKIGNNELEIKIKQPSLEIVGSMIEEIPEREFEETFPDEISMTSSGSYEDKITLENQKLVKDYFKELSKS
ncbi:MAG: hypothetical protein KKC75_07330 [Nanoarchaeota archaeon]|nr:hypothetical protein [Nanoarchaeota archaeon]MBU1004544.1 hypothetical protein [Nanoarchaeota archaeon]MBU1945919.1 hypothetical protein [Nanoarchaeota archaeon]